MTSVFSGDASSGEIYGFSGDDIIAFDIKDNAPASISFFGGIGNDIFQISGDYLSSTLVRIADYEDGESIQISKVPFDNVQEMQLETLTSTSGLGYTRVSVDDQLLFEMDGIFGSDLLENIQII